MSADERTLALFAAALSIIAFLPAIAGGVMFNGRKFLNWERAQSKRWLYWERSLWIAGYIILLLGVSLLVELLKLRGETIVSQLGLMGFGFGILLLIVVEGYSLDGQVWSTYLIRLAVILLLLSQALLGASILRVDVLPAWLGWSTIVWNIGWFLVLLRANDPYFPAMYFIMPLVIAITMLFAIG